MFETKHVCAASLPTVVLRFPACPRACAASAATRRDFRSTLVVASRSNSKPLCLATTKCNNSIAAGGLGKRGQSRPAKCAHLPSPPCAPKRIESNSTRTSSLVVSAFLCLLCSGGGDGEVDGHRGTLLGDCGYRHWIGAAGQPTGELRCTFTRLTDCLV